MVHYQLDRPNLRDIPVFRHFELVQWNFYSLSEIAVGSPAQKFGT